VDIDRNNALQIKALGVIISTFETLPGHRGFLEMPLRGVRENTGALLHEIVHIYAPNNNRFLAEGLAVYLHTGSEYDRNRKLG
jgi:hypothetical protein